MSDLPDVPEPQGFYVPAVAHGGLVFSAGMTPRVGGRLAIKGIVGADVDIETARRAAGIAARNALAAVAAKAGGVAGIAQCLQLRVFVACADGFTALSEVGDGASATIAAQLGADRLPARSVIGVQSLPSGAPVELELLVALRE